MTETTDSLEYYAAPGIMTDPGEHADLLAGLPDDVPGLVKVVQGVLLHMFWAEAYGQELSEERKAEANLRQVSERLAGIRAADPRPLAEPRPADVRQVGTCRDYAVVLAALLKHQGVPARVRCGFGAYFTPGKYEDHWVGEYWHASEKRWVLVDAQLDDLQREKLNITFDTFDVPRDQFLVAGKAWQLARSGAADPQNFGIFDMWGLWFIRGDLVRDLAALNKVEILPWDWEGWPLIEAHDEDLTEADMALLDRVAALTQAGNESFSQVRAIYENNAGLRMPPNWAKQD